VIGWYLLASLALGVYLAICVAAPSAVNGALHYSAAAEELSKSIPTLVMSVIGYLALVLSFNVVIRVYLLRDLWVTVLQPMQLEGHRRCGRCHGQGRTC